MCRKMGTKKGGRLPNTASGAEEVRGYARAHPKGGPT